MADDTHSHYKDCCCARAWEALGVTTYTGMSIPEHIDRLRADLAVECEQHQAAQAALSVSARHVDQLLAAWDKLQTDLTSERQAREQAEASVQRLQKTVDFLDNVLKVRP